MSTQIKRSVLLVFVDGLGVADSAPHNPLSQISLPAIEGLLGGTLTTETLTAREQDGRTATNGVLFKAIDACLGVDGLPQSATGQASLFTGRNAAQLLGRHVPALPGAKLKELIESHSVFRVLSEAGFRSAFANAFSDRFFEYVKKPRARLRPSASVAAVRAGGVRLRGEQDLLRGEAVTWDVTRSFFGLSLPRLRLRAQGGESTPLRSENVPEITAAEAGGHLYNLAQANDFTLFETFLTDLAGHGRYVVDPELALGRLDGLLAGLVRAAAASEQGGTELTVVITSDHGNVEDTLSPLHTRNPIPLVAWGPGAEVFSEAASLVDCVPSLLRYLRVKSDEFRLVE